MSEENKNSRSCCFVLDYVITPAVVVFRLCYFALFSLFHFSDEGQSVFPKTFSLFYFSYVML